MRDYYARAAERGCCGTTGEERYGTLVPDKEQAFREAFRVLRPGGRMVVADLVRDRPRRAGAPVDPERWAACVDGAETKEVYLQRIRRAGFTAVQVLARGGGEVFSITVRARKPAAR